MTLDQKEFLIKWVAALRSGEYNQGKCNWFDEYENTYCCLGVANKISGKELNELGQYEKNDGVTSTIPLGLDYHQIAELMRFNDTLGMTFDEIAYYIERTYIK